MKTVIMLSVVASVLLWPGPGLASNETEALVAKAKEIVTPRTVQGGKSLQDIFAWFAKVEQIGDAELNFQLLRAGTQYMKIDAGEQPWRYIGAGKTVSVHTGEKKHVWGEGVGLEVALGVPLFPAAECPWLSNSVHTAYIRFSLSSEFNNTDKVDRYVVSLDLRKAYYVEGKKEVAYPFPFVNARPDMTQEEWECQRDLPGYLKDIERRIARYVKSCGPIEPNRRYVIKAKGEWSGRPEFDYVMFGDDGQSMTCVEYFPKRGESAAEAVVRDFNRANNQYELCLLKSDGSIVDCDSIVDGKLERNKDGKFGNAFVLRVLARLSLTAAEPTCLASTSNQSWAQDGSLNMNASVVADDELRGPEDSNDRHECEDQDENDFAEWDWRLQGQTWLPQ